METCWRYGSRTSVTLQCSAVSMNQPCQCLQDRDMGLMSISGNQDVLWITQKRWEVLTCATIAQKTKKWWRKLFFHLMNVCMFNAFRLYSKFSLDERKKDHRCFRISLIQQLITEVGGPRGQSVRRGQPIIGEMPARLVGRPFPEFIPAKAGAKRLKPLRDCVACHQPRQNRDGFKRKQTSFWCSDCCVALCVPDCFRLYHTHLNYQNAINQFNAVME